MTINDGKVILSLPSYSNRYVVEVERHGYRWEVDTYHETKASAFARAETLYAQSHDRVRVIDQMS